MLNATLQVTPIGTPVRFGGNDGDRIPGVVNAICVREGDHVTYEVVYWDGRTRKCEWMERRELIVEEKVAKVVRIGFGVGRED